MNARMRLTFFCGTCLGLALGFAAGHVSLWTRVAHTVPASSAALIPFDPQHSASIGTEGFDLSRGGPVLESSPNQAVPVPGGAVVLNDPDLGDEPVHADALVELPVPANHPGGDPFNPRTRLAPPQSLPTTEAKPLTQANNTETVPDPAPASEATAVGLHDPSPDHPKPELDPEVVEMLKDELEGVSEQQREVWADALQGMNPADAAGVILMWKKFGQNGGAPNHLSSPPPLFRSSHPDAIPTPLDQSGALRGHPDAMLSSEDLATRISQHNLANRETCGFMELVPVLKELPFDQSSGQEHVQVIGYRLDTEPGRHVETGNPSHVSVQRGCFFAVKLPTGEEQYTRVGRLVLDAERRLCVDLGDQDLPITPELKLPEGATRFLVQNGQLQVEVANQQDPTIVGPMQVAEFFDASRLQPMGGCLYGATTASGKPKMVVAELIFQTLEYPSIEDPSRMAHR